MFTNVGKFSRTAQKRKQNVQEQQKKLEELEKRQKKYVQQQQRSLLEDTRRQNIKELAEWQNINKLQKHKQFEIDKEDIRKQLDLIKKQGATSPIIVPTDIQTIPGIPINVQKIGSETSQEQIKPETNQEQTVPKTDQKQINIETTQEQTVPKTDQEQTVPKTDQEQISDIKTFKEFGKIWTIKKDKADILLKILRFAKYYDPFKNAVLKLYELTILILDIYTDDEFVDMIKEILNDKQLMGILDLLEQHDKDIVELFDIFYPNDKIFMVDIYTNVFYELLLLQLNAVIRKGREMHRYSKFRIFAEAFSRVLTDKLELLNAMDIKPISEKYKGLGSQFQDEPPISNQFTNEG